MKIKANALKDCFDKAGKSYFCFLFYGSDEGAVVQNARSLANKLKESKTPVEEVILTAEILKENPARLNEEMTSNSLFSTRKFLWIKNPPDSLFNEIDTYLKSPTSETPILIITSDTFNTKSKTVSLVNDLPNAVALGCYIQEGADLRSFISSTLQAQKFLIEPDALSFLMESLGADKRATVSEINKLMLYKGNDKRITLKDAEACFAGFAPTSTDDLWAFVLTGQQDRALKKLTLLLEEGISSVSIIRVFLYKFEQLMRVQNLIANGMQIDSAIKKVPSFIPFKYADTWKKIILSWKAEYVKGAFSLTLEAEKNSKSGIPDTLLLKRFIARLTQAGKKSCAS